MQKRSTGFWTACGVTLLAGLGFLQYFYGQPLNWILLYAALAAGVDRVNGPKIGIIFSAMATAVWIMAGGVSLTSNSWEIGTWNILMGFATILSAHLLLWLWRKTPEQVARATRTDALTGLLNRQGFTEIALSEAARCRRHGRALTLVCLDIDEFKRINKEKDHAAGDALLRFVGEVLQKGVRTSDFASHLEGDAFMLLLPEMDVETTRLAVNRILGLLHQKLESGYPGTTLRAGGITYTTVPKTDEAFRTEMDRLRFIVKANPKASIKIQES